MKPQILRISQLATTPSKPGLLPVSPATIWRWVRNDKFPKPFKLGASVTGWYAHEIEAFVAARHKEAA